MTWEDGERRPRKKNYNSRHEHHCLSAELAVPCCVRVKVEADTRKAWLVAYMPASELSHETAGATLDRLAGGSGIKIEWK